MKPRNFPARKLARKLAAEQGFQVGTVWRLTPEDTILAEERKKRSKKRRGS